MFDKLVQDAVDGMKKDFDARIDRLEDKIDNLEGKIDNLTAMVGK